MARPAANSAAEATAPVAADTGAGAQAEASSSKGEGRAGRPAAQGIGRRNRIAQNSKHSKRNDAVSKLAHTLAARLSYASFKVSKGWTRQSISEVEHLHSSRFRKQAVERARRSGTSPHPLLGLDRGSPPKQTDVQAVPGQYRESIFTVQGHSTYAPVRGYTHEPPHSEPQPYFVNSDLQFGSEQQDALRFQAQNVFSDQPSRTNTPLQQQSADTLLSPSMSHYLVSPLAPGSSRRSPSIGPSAFVRTEHEAPDQYTPGYSRKGAAVMHTASLPHGDFWRSTSSSALNAGAGLDLGPAMPWHGGPMPAVTYSPANQGTSAALLPAQDPRFAAQGSNMARQRPARGPPGQPGSVAPAAGLRSEYSLSNVTMDDLDLQFE